MARASPAVIHDANQAGKLESLAGSGACEAGRVVVLDFAAVRAAMGDRWAQRRDDIHRRIERDIQRSLSRSAVLLQISDREYLVSFADAQGAAAQVLAFNIMEELLTHFLGRCDPQDLIVKGVTSLSAHDVQTRPLVREDVERLGREEGAAHPAAPSPPPVFGPVSILIEGPAERLDLRLAPQDVLHLSSGLVIGARMSVILSRVGAERCLSSREEGFLSPGALLQTTREAMTGMRELMEGSQRPAVFVLPLFLQTLTSSRGRAVVLDQLRRFRAFDRRRLIVEVTGVERGTPPSRLMEAALRLRPFCRAVTGRAPLERSVLAAVSEARLSGVHMSAQDLGSTPLQLAAGLLAAGQSARGLAPMVMAVDLPDQAALKVCAVAGFSHATLPARGT